MLSHRENYLRAARFQRPEWIPAGVHINDASWDLYRRDMEKVALKYPEYFPHVHEGWRDYENFAFPPAYRKGEKFRDNWGCIWESPVNGIEGVVTGFPLEDWSALESWSMPDIETLDDRGPRNWAETQRRLRESRAKGDLIFAGLPHGFLFLRMTYLRGFENAMCDMFTDDEDFAALFDRLVDYNLELVKRYLAIGVDVMSFPEDLGMQNGPIFSPAMFEKWFVPAYSKLMQPCREAGVLTHFHSDGRTLDILDAQIRAGVNIVNPQDLVNGIDELAKHIKGRACIDLDIDRQSILPYGTPKEIDELIEEEVRKLGSPDGGLMMIAGIYPPTPPENVDALCAALQKYREYWR